MKCKDGTTNVKLVMVNDGMEYPNGFGEVPGLTKDSDVRAPIWARDGLSVPRQVHSLDSTVDFIVSCSGLNGRGPTVNRSNVSRGWLSSSGSNSDGKTMV